MSQYESCSLFDLCDTQQEQPMIRGVTDHLHYVIGKASDGIG